MLPCSFSVVIASNGVGPVISAFTKIQTAALFATALISLNFHAFGMTSNLASTCSSYWQQDLMLINEIDGQSFMIAANKQDSLSI